MSDIDLDVGVGDMPMLIKWDISHHTMFTLEIDTDAVEAVIPERMVPVEVRPDVSLLSIAVLKYFPGNFGPGSPVFDETVAVIAVQPNLELDMPLPRFSFYALNIISDSPDFVASEAERVFTPTELSAGLRCDFEDDGLGVRVEDEHGPILEFHNTHPEPSYKHTGFWGQHFNDTRPRMYSGPWHWEGELFEHQKRGDWGKVHPHPFFKGLDLSSIRTCYRQFFAVPMTHSYERFYAVKPLV